VKYKKSDVIRNVQKIPDIRFGAENLTSFAGAVIIQKFFQKIRLYQMLRSCFVHLKGTPAYGHERIVMIIMLNLLLGYRQIHAMSYLRNDPLYRRIVGLKQLPSHSTVSRALSKMDRRSYSKLRKLARHLVLRRLALERPARLTLDFDGSVNSTKSRQAEGTAVGFNKQKKGARSYYPLYCTVAQTGQILDHRHRPGNVHDSRHSLPFMKYCFRTVRSHLGRVIQEARMDSAFFSEKTAQLLNLEKVLFTISTPFHRFAQLKAIISRRRKWKRINGELSYFEIDWRPKSWKEADNFRFIAIRSKTHRIRREPLQLDLFEPIEEYYEYRVIMTNMTGEAGRILKFHNGRGSQEGVFAELKSNTFMDYIPTRRLVANQIYMTAAILIHNCLRELQMLTGKKSRAVNGSKRPALWKFISLQTFRQQILQNAGRLIRPGGTLVLEMNASKKFQNVFLGYLHALDDAA